jgi:hypothetical protein
LRARGFCFFKLQRTRLFEVRYEHSHQPTVSAPKYRVATTKIRTLSHDGGVRIYFYSLTSREPRHAFA